MNKDFFSGLKSRFLQLIAKNAPGGDSLRVWLHRCRGVKIGSDVWIGYDVILETSRPYLIHIGDRVTINARVMLIAHFRDSRGIFIDDDVFVGPGSIILPNVKIGKGAVIAAGSVVSASVPPNTMVRGNPARPVAHQSIPLNLSTPMNAFYKSLKPIRRKPGDA